MKKKAKRSAARRRSTSTHRNSSNTSLMATLMHKKHRPLQGLALGGVMFLLQSFWGMLALLGAGLMIISALALVLRKAKS